MSIVRAFAVCACLAAAPVAMAGTINFDNLSLLDFGAIASNYGDHGAGGAGDANVGVTYSGSNGTTNNLLFWNNDYGDLSKVAFTPSNGTNARITLTADAGWVITSLSFDLAGWSHSDLGARVLSIDFGSIDDLAGTTIQGDGNGPQHSSFSYASAAGVGSASIEWGTNWNIGIDNIVFTVARAASGTVPEPLSLALAGSALGLLGLARRRQRA